MTEEMNKLIDLMRATSKFDTNNPEFDRGWAAAMSVVIRELRSIKEPEPEPCQCPPGPEPGIAEDPKASWRFKGDSYTRATSCGTPLWVSPWMNGELTVWLLKASSPHPLATCPTPEKAMELADEYAQANGGWAD